MKPLAVDEEEGEIVLIPASCLHYPVGDVGLIEKFVQRVQEEPRARTILLGDMMDQDRTHRRKHRKGYVEDRSSVPLHDDRQNRADVEELAHMLSPISDKIYGILQGNHYFEYASGVTSDQYLCELLGVPYCGPLGFFRVRLKSGTVSRNLIIWAHHSGGTMGGRTTGGSINALLRQEAGWDADIYLMGHDHRRTAWCESTMTITSKGSPRVVERSRVFARVGAFLKTYKHEDCIPRKAPHFPGYGEEKAFRPADLGWVEITARLLRSVDREPFRIAYDIFVPGLSA